MAVKEPVQAPAPVQERYRFTRREYHALAAAGVLEEDARVELIRGDIAVMSPINPRHASAVDRLTAVLSAALAGRAVVRVQSPFIVNEDTEPQPDVTLLKPRADFYAAEHPEAKDLFLAIEVADTSLRYDHEVKLPLYATAGLAEVWLLNLSENVLEVYREPGPKGYRSLQRLSPGDQVSPLAFSDLTFSVAALLPPGA
jgi:Uma2 family endonuclease